MNNQKLSNYQNLLNIIDKRIIAVTPQEYVKKYPEQSEDWDTVNKYLILMDSDECKTVEDCILSGAFSVEIQKNEIYASWMNYPTEPIIGEKNFTIHLLTKIQEHDKED
jgi:hypothetical protein